MYFEINVSLNGRHFFATSERSLRTLSEAQTVYRELKKAFPDNKGYSVTVRKYCLCSSHVGME